jgi:hypothetical protein
MQKIKEVNATTGEETERNLTAKETDFLNKEIASAKDAASVKLEKESLRASAIDKLAALGLTPEEIAAITGAN